jgi:peptide-methionine (R)-S-oxide reductase
MNRRAFLQAALGAGTLAFLPYNVFAYKGKDMGSIEKIHKTDDEWKAILTPDQYFVLRREGTEKAFSNPLHHESAKGVYVCAACKLPLFTSEMKYDSGTGWPSFFAVMENSVETKRDFKIIYPRTEYHCARCGGHQGHVFSDGPKPGNHRFCNNGAALLFIPYTGK